MSDFVSQILGAVERQMDERLNSFETAIPGIVKEVREDGKIDVAPSIRKMVTSGVIDKFDLPIKGVPVMQIGFSGMSFDLELSKGDSVILLFFSRESSNWKKHKWGQSDPKAPLANDVNNCVAIPFVRPDSEANAVVKVDKNGLVTFDSSKVKFTGDVEIEGNVKSVGNIKSNSKIEADGDIESGGDVKGSDFKTDTLSFNIHVHSVAGPGMSGGPESPPST